MSESAEEPVIIHTDGGCRPNPGPGGWAFILRHPKSGRWKENSGGEHATTNNRMELMAAIVALESLKRRCQVKLYSDSKYVVDAIELGWAERWRENNWKRNKKDKAINPDLWERLLDLCEKHDVEFAWVKAHAGNRENERCDQLAKLAAYKMDLIGETATQGDVNQ